MGKTTYDAPVIEEVGAETPTVAAVAEVAAEEAAVVVTPAATLDSEGNIIGDDGKLYSPPSRPNMIDPVCYEDSVDPDYQWDPALSLISALWRKRILKVIRHLSGELTYRDHGERAADQLSFYNDFKAACNHENYELFKVTMLFMIQEFRARPNILQEDIWDLFQSSIPRYYPTIALRDLEPGRAVLFNMIKLAKDWGGRVNFTSRYNLDYMYNQQQPRAKANINRFFISVKTYTLKPAI